jgi:hypothetical protein
MFINRQRAYFDAVRFRSADNIRWKSAGDHIFKHENFMGDLFYGNPEDMQQIVQSPRMLDLVFAKEEDQAA